MSLEQDAAMNANSPAHNPNVIFEQAVRWLEGFREGTAARSAFFAWLAESPRHVEELGFALALSEEIAQLTPQQRAEIEAMMTKGNADSELGGNVVPLWENAALSSNDTAKTAPSRRAAWAVALAAGLGCLAVGLWWLLARTESQTYVSQIGELRTVQLADGSTVHLNARSRLEVRFTTEVRDLQLLEGEALFNVAHDAARPFRVRADAAVIQALGTQFNIRKRPSGTVVSVLEGRVQVTEESARASQPLSAGEEVRIERSGRIEKRKLAEAATVTAWHQRRLVFKDEPLADIAAEFNRYNLKPQIRIEGTRARARHFAGTFDADAPQALMEALQDPALIIEQTGDEIVVRDR
jgi:transmembrane sensor